MELTTEQARETLKDCWRYMLRDNALILTTGHSFDELLEALQMGADALERMLPQEKVKKEKDGWTLIQCPLCQNPISVASNFCNICGQALKNKESEYE